MSSNKSYYSDLINISRFDLNETISIPNTPIITASTFLFKNAEAATPITSDSLHSNEIENNYYYGSVGTPTTAMLAKAISIIEGGKYTVVTPSGHSAIVTLFMTLLKPGDHILVVDSAVYSTKWFCDNELKQLSISVTYFDPSISIDAIQYLIKSNTRLIFFESPSSYTFEVQDIPGISKVAKDKGIIVVQDNTWAASTYFCPFEYDVDISILSLTKYHAGSLGVVLGAIVTCSSELYKSLKSKAAILGMSVCPYACYLASAQLSTLKLRVEKQSQTAITIVKWLKDVKEIGKIMYPILEESIGHYYWKRDFTGVSSIFSIELNTFSEKQIELFLNALKLFKLGHGWGGNVSLVFPFNPSVWRTVSTPPTNNNCLRFYIGLEEADYLIEDLKNAFESIEHCK